jgi:hypothetical protein
LPANQPKEATMSYHKPLLIAASSACLLLLSACATTATSTGEQDTAKQICKNLKQDMADGSRSSMAVGNNPTQEAQLQKSYARYQCPDVLNETK